jgi:protein-S-isoprenylcysteine O-methyltransferase Ste14
MAFGEEVAMKHQRGVLLASAASTLVYLGLAIWGRGGFTAFFAQPALRAIVAVTILLAVVGVFSQGNLSAGQQEDRANRWVFVVFTVVGVTSGFLPAYTDRIGFLTFGGETIRWLGVIIFAAGGALRIWPVFVLGSRFSGLVAIQPGHTLQTTGIYSIVRNPSYLGLLVNALGWALAFRSAVGILLALLYIPPLLARMRAEEALLHAHFGAEYDAYCARTPRLVPGLY